MVIPEACGMHNFRTSAFMCPIKLMKCIHQHVIHSRSISTAGSLRFAANLRQRSANLLQKSATVFAPAPSREHSSSMNRCFAKERQLLFNTTAPPNGNVVSQQQVLQNGGSRRFFCNQSEMAGATSFHVQDYDDFKERVLNADKPIVVDFFADWCGPCKLLGPRLESMIDSKGGEVMLAKVNVDDNTELAMEYGVRSVPTVIGFKDGQVVSQFVGLSEDAEIKSFLNNLTNS